MISPHFVHTCVSSCNVCHETWLGQRSSAHASFAVIAANSRGSVKFSRLGAQRCQQKMHGCAQPDLGLLPFCTAGQYKNSQQLEEWALAQVVSLLQCAVRACVEETWGQACLAREQGQQDRTNIPAYLGEQSPILQDMHIPDPGPSPSWQPWPPSPAHLHRVSDTLRHSRHGHSQLITTQCRLPLNLRLTPCNASRAPAKKLTKEKL